MLIGEVARQAGVSRDAVRLYTRLGLVPHKARQAGSRLYADYGEGTVELVEGIKIRQSIGFSFSPSSPPSPPRTSPAPWTTASSERCWPPSWTRSKRSGASSARWQYSSAPSFKTWNQRGTAPKALLSAVFSAYSLKSLLPA